MKSIYLMIFFFCMFNTACTDLLSINKDEWKIYKIKQGQQNASNTTIAINNENTISFYFKFDSSAIYKTINPENQADINKLYGFSDCGDKHQDNSARFGWRWISGKLEIHAFVHKNKSYISKFLGYADLNKEYLCSLSASGTNYVFTFNKKATLVSRGCDTIDKINRYMLYPYFGGTECAPHEIRLSIKEL